MSSRIGPRAAGSDGSDFLHREKVAGHYKDSVVNKSRVKSIITLHVLMIILMVFRLSTSFFVMAGKRPPSFLQRYHLPKAMTWEYVWLTSALPALFGLLALNKNRLFLMQQYFIGQFVFGLLPVLYGIWDLSDELVAYMHEKATNVLFLGYPMVLIWNFMLVVMLQIHCFGTYFSFHLLKAWTAGQRQQKKK